MIHIAIVEDDNSWAELLADYLHRYEAEYGESFHIRRYHDGYEIVEKYPGDLEIILMDIEMGLMDGMEAAEQIRKIDEGVEIIFVTNMAQYAIRGYRVRALDYILKPLEYRPFAESIRRVIRTIRSTKEKYLTISTRNGNFRVELMQILWVESRGHRLTFHLEETSIETTVYTMKDLEEELKEDGFARCNSGCLVNLRKVESFTDKEVVVKGSPLPVSRGRKAAFMEALNHAFNM